MYYNIDNLMGHNKKIKNVSLYYCAVIIITALEWRRASVSNLLLIIIILFLKKYWYCFSFYFVVMLENKYTTQPATGFYISIIEIIRIQNRFIDWNSLLLLLLLLSRRRTRFIISLLFNITTGLLDKIHNGMQHAV
jgi:hypothetical protein